MGACFSQPLDSKNRIASYKKDSYSSTFNQNTNPALEAQQSGSKIKAIFPITLDQVNKSIDEWKELTKRRKPKPMDIFTEEKNLFIEDEGDIKKCLSELNKEIIDIEINRKDKIRNINLNTSDDESLGIDTSNNDNEINQDFLNMNKKFNRGFSEISSTIHFTAMNSKDLASSKLINKFHQQTNHNNGNSVKSQSIVNVLDELNNNYKIGTNYIERDSYNINVKRNLEKNKIYIQNNDFMLNTQNEVREISVSILEKSKMTIRKKDLNVNTNNNNSYFNNNFQINSYFIVNRTLENHNNTIEENLTLTKNNNDATIQSVTLHSNQEFYQENIYYNVDKLQLNENSNKIQNSKVGLKYKNKTEINGVIIPQWAEEFERLAHYQKKQILGSKIIIDDVDGMKIDWKRLSQMSKFSEDSKVRSITQGVGNNCSIVAALIAINNYEKMFQKNLLNSIVYPQNKEKAIYNKFGYYGVKLNFNGCIRYFEVDDYIPYNQQKGVLSKSNDSICNLIEKALLILYNGTITNQNSTHFSFSIRSNPSYEIYHISGWIPEIVMFQDISNKSNLWQRLYTNFTEGNIMVCIGTGALKDACRVPGSDALISNSTNFIQEHSYTVIDVLELTDRRLMKCKNPWSNTLPSIAFNFANIKKFKNDTDESYSKDEENGFFWIDWDNVLEGFAYIFLAWNPDIYSCKYSLVSSWKNTRSVSKFYDEAYSLEFNPQYFITIPEHSEDFEVRILLTKHISVLDNMTKNRKKISFKLFWYEGYPVVYPVDQLRTLQNPSREVNSDVFIFEASNQVEQYALVILKNEDRDEEESEVSFSLDIFSFIELEVKEIPKREIIHSKSQRFLDTWHPTKPGGNLTSSNFVYNPQYKLEITSTCHIQVKLETAVSTPIMICLIENGNHVSKIPYDYIINNKNPGFFFNAFSYFECMLCPGDYIIVCVSQEDKSIGRYCLEVNTIRNSKLAMSDVKIDKIIMVNFPFMEILRGEWDKKNSKDICEQNPLVTIKNPGFVFNSTQTTKVKFTLKSNVNLKINNQNGIADYPSITIVLYKIEPDDNYSIILNGNTKPCSAWGYYSDEVEIEANFTYMVVCVNLNKNQFSKFELEIQSKNRLINISPNTQITQKKNNFNIYSKWSKTNSGGGLNEITFYKNPQYELTTAKQTEAYIELVSYDSFTISLILIETDVNSLHKDLNELDNEIVESALVINLEYAQEVYMKKVILNSGKRYILIPFTKSANQIGCYDLTISTGEDVIVKEILSKVFQNQNIFYLNNQGLCELTYMNQQINNHDNKFIKSSFIKDCAFFKTSSLGPIYIRLKSTSSTCYAKLGLALFAILDNSSIKLITHNDNLCCIPFGTNTNIKETAKGFLLIVLSDTHETQFSYQIVIDSNYLKIIDFVQINESSFQNLFFN